METIKVNEGLAPESDQMTTDAPQQGAEAGDLDAVAPHTEARDAGHNGPGAQLPGVGDTGGSGADPSTARAQGADAPAGIEDGPAEPQDEGFGRLGLAADVARAVAELGYETATAVQRQCIPHLLAGRDLLGQAQTGTGKTAAFALPLLSRLDAESALPQVLVLTPTRELALQVAEALQRYARYLKGFHVLPIYGGQSYGLQVRQLERAPQVVVATPGRIMDHMRRGTLSLDALKALVLDEADEMLNMGFAEDIDWIFEHTPPDRQVALFSATMPPEILRVARDHLDDPVEIRIASATATVDTIDQQHCVVTRFHKLDVLTRILELEAFDGMLIFVRTKGGTTELADKLRSQGFAAEPLNGDMNQEMRERAVDRIKGGKLDILVATDVAARGLDVERISHVVNFDIPTDPSAYVHRIGRTGRAGRAGKAILLVEPRERGLLRAIERTIRRSIPEMDVPSAAQLSASRIDRFTAQLRETLAEQDLDFFYRLIARIAKEQEMDPMDIAAASSFLIQRERPLDVKETPRDNRREGFREGGYERPRRQSGDRADRGDDRRFARTEGGGERRPPYAQDWGDSGRRFEGRGERPSPGFDRDRGNLRDERRPGQDRDTRPSERPFRDDRSFRSDRDSRPTDRPFQPGRGYGAEARPFQRDRAGREDRPRFEGGRDAGWDDRRPRAEREPGRAPLRERDGNRETRRDDRLDDDRGNRIARAERERPAERPRDDFRPRRDEPHFEGGSRQGREHRDGRSGVDLVRHRIEVGHRDGVTPREIVGAIANETGLEGRFIGHIDIRDDHATVDLPAGMPREIFRHLKQVFVCGRALQISVLDGPRDPQSRPPRDDRDDRPRPPRSQQAGAPGKPRRFGPSDAAPRGPGSDQGFRRKRRD